MSSYKLYYFNARSYAELIRFVFAQAGVRYEDVRLSVEEWSKLKPGKPMQCGQEDTYSDTLFLVFSRFALGHDAHP